VRDWPRLALQAAQAVNGRPQKRATPNRRRGLARWRSGHAGTWWRRWGAKRRLVKPCRTAPSEVRSRTQNVGRKTCRVAIMAAPACLRLRVEPFRVSHRYLVAVSAHSSDHSATGTRKRNRKGPVPGSRNRTRATEPRLDHSLCGLGCFESPRTEPDGSYRLGPREAASRKELQRAVNPAQTDSRPSAG
jgi:hypothetical protein